MASRILQPQLLSGAKLAQLGWLKELACSLATLQQFHHVSSHWKVTLVFMVTVSLCTQQACTRSKTVFQRHHALADHFHLELGALPDILDTIYAHTAYRSYFFPPIHHNVSDFSGQNISNCSSARAHSLLRQFSFSACQGARMKRTCSPQQLRHQLLRCQWLQG